MPAPEGVPAWLWKPLLSVVGGILAIVSAILGWVGKRYIQHRQSQIDDLREDIEELQENMANDHSGVEDQVARLDDKLDKLIQEVKS